MIFLISIFFVFESLYFLQMLQQNSYNGKNRFLVFLFKNIKSNVNYYALKYLFAVSLLLFSNFETILYIYFFIIMFILIYSSFLQYKKYNKKLPLVFTLRIYRILILELLFYILLLVLMFNKSLTNFIGTMLLFVSLIPFVLILIIYLLAPVEKAIYEMYKRKALKKLNKMGDISIIGVTGSILQKGLLRL